MSIPDAPPMAPPLLGAGAPPAPPMSFSSSLIPPAPSFSSSFPTSSSSASFTSEAPPPTSSTSTSTSSALVPAPDSSTQVSLAGIQSIPVKKTIMIVNNFVINTTEFVNKFATLCERKLQRIQQQSQRLEIVLALLETKLGSIHWLNGGDATIQVPTTLAPTTTDSSVPAAPSLGEGAPSAPPMDGPPAAPAAPAAPTGMLLKDDPRYAQYFKMLRLKVPKPALKQKMQADGVDPDIIDLDPEGPAPPPDASSTSSALVPVPGSDSESDNESDEEA